VVEERATAAEVRIAAPAQFLGDVGRNIFRPAFGSVEADHTYRVLVLSGAQVGDDGFQVSRFRVGLAPDAAITTEIVYDQIDILINTLGGPYRGGPV
jgi:hypothetical protein